MSTQNKGGTVFEFRGINIDTPQSLESLIRAVNGNDSRQEGWSENALMAGFNCNPNTALEEMQALNASVDNGSPSAAYVAHVAFAPGEATIDKAFVKSYCAACLEGAVIVLALVIFTAFAASPPVVNSGAAAVTQVWSYTGELAFNMLVLVGAVKAADRTVHELIGA